MVEAYGSNLQIDASTALVTSEVYDYVNADLSLSKKVKETAKYL